MLKTNMHLNMLTQLYQSCTHEEIFFRGNLCVSRKKNFRTKKKFFPQGKNSPRQNLCVGRKFFSLGKEIFFLVQGNFFSCYTKFASEIFFACQNTTAYGHWQLCSFRHVSIATCSLIYLNMNTGNFSNMQCSSWKNISAC